jgi:hypothetical protein
MANTKISALTAATTPVAGTEVLPIVQSSTTKQVSIANLTAGRAISATQITLTAGNLIVANGYGVDFSATPGTGTSELFADYEEGSWTPVQGSGLTVVGAFSSSGAYTKIGNMVYVKGLLAAATSITSGAGGEFCSGLPYSALSNSVGGVANAGYTVLTGIRAIAASLYSVNSQSATTSLAFSISYQV